MAVDCQVKKNMIYNTTTFSQEINRNPYKYRQEVSDWVLRNFTEGDIAITLTYKEFDEQFSAKFSYDYIRQISDVKHYLNKVNRKFLGRAQGKNNPLRVAYAIELNEYNGLHIHMILQVPPIDRVPKKHQFTLLSTLWAEMRLTGKRAGIDIQEIDNKGRWVGYMLKGFFENNSDRNDMQYWVLDK